ncbi:hypothetical protein HOH45_08790 [bacterium]|nr:hypothetical protein [bacterium]
MYCITRVDEDNPSVKLYATPFDPENRTEADERMDKYKHNMGQYLASAEGAVRGVI